jgi:hypothetical protein
MIGAAFNFIEPARVLYASHVVFSKQLHSPNGIYGILRQWAQITLA